MQSSSGYMCALRESLGDIDRIEMYALLLSLLSLSLLLLLLLLLFKFYIVSD